MILGSKLSLALLLFALTWGWLAGCGPKPVTRIVEPSLAWDSTAVVEPDAVVESDKENERQSVQNDNPYQDALAPGPAASSGPITEVEKPSLVHKVRWGHETLYTIALWYTGSGNNWRRLAAANPEIRPRKMRIGTMVRIPGPLLTKRRPMPENYLKPNPNRERKPAKQPPSKSVEPTESPPLYGPVEQPPALYGPVGVTPQTPAEEDRELPVPLETLDE